MIKSKIVHQTHEMTYVGIIGGGRPPPPLLPGGGGGPRPGGADGAALGGAGAGGCLFTGGGGFLLGPPPGDEGGTLDLKMGKRLRIRDIYEKIRGNDLNQLTKHLALASNHF